MGNRILGTDTDGAKATADIDIGFVDLIGRVGALGFQLDPGADLDAVIEGNGTVEMDFRILLDIDADMSGARAPRLAEIVIDDTDNAFEPSAKRELGFCLGCRGDHKADR
jgi:hypothetical protein